MRDDGKNVDDYDTRDDEMLNEKKCYWISTHTVTRYPDCYYFFVDQYLDGSDDEIHKLFFVEFYV